MKACRSNRTLTLSHARWSAFAAAAASTVYTTSTAEAEIHYSGIVNAKFNSSSGFTTQAFPLSQGVSIAGKQFGNRIHTYDFALFAVKGAALSDELVASNDFDIVPVGKGKFLSGQRFYSPRYTYGIIQTYLCSNRIRRPGTYFIGFRFNNGAGVQYGWARIRWGGCPVNFFILRDYAWGDVGDPVKAGQKSLGPERLELDDIDVDGSLGQLAFGARCVEGWRAKRAAAVDH